MVWFSLYLNVYTYIHCTWCIQLAATIGTPSIEMYQRFMATVYSSEVKYFEEHSHAGIREDDSYFLQKLFWPENSWKTQHGNSTHL